MKFFKIKNKKLLTPVKSEPFRLESEIQKITEANLDTIFGLTFVCSQFVVKNFRIDTLAFDEKNKSFSIIEYKCSKNSSVIDQGVSYLRVLLDYRAEFILAYNEECKKRLERKDVDWRQTRILFIAPSFTTYQKEATGFGDLPIDLWQITRYENDSVSYAPIVTKTSASIQTVAPKSDAIKSVTREIKSYSEEELLEKSTIDTKELYNRVKAAILELGDIEIKVNKHYISFTSNSANIVDIVLNKKDLVLWLNLKRGELNDPQKLAVDAAGLGHLGNGDYKIILRTGDLIDDTLPLIKQSLRKNQR